MNVTLEQLYAEACKALGEVVIAQRLLSAEVTSLSAEVERLTPPVENNAASEPQFFEPPDERP